MLGSFISGRSEPMKKKIIRIIISLILFLGVLLGGAFLVSNYFYKKAMAKLESALKETTTEACVYGTIADVDDNSQVSESTDTYKKAVIRLSYEDYAGTSVIAVNGNIPFFTDDEIVMTSYELYSDLDKEERVGPAIACLSKDLQPMAPRDFDLSEIKPSGFINRHYPELIEEDGWLYHRCHIIGYQLAGETTNEKNLFTGTRYLNENSMLYQENTVAQYLRDYPGIHIMYRVTPIFREDELVARGVLMEAFSVEDNGGLQFCVYCFNVQPGIEIDYKTGKSEVGG